MRCFALLALLLCAPVRAADPPAKLDRFGDPLPAGALMRLGTLRGSARITSFGVAADGTVVTVGADADVRVWPPDADAPDAVERLPVKVPADWSVVSDVSPDGKRIACRTADAVVVFERHKDKPATEVASFKLPGRRLLFAPDGNTLAVVSGLDAVAVHLCDVKTGGTRALAEGLKYVREVAFSGDGRRVVINTAEELILHSAENGKELARWAVDGHHLATLALDRAGETVAARMYNTETREYLGVRFFDAKTGKPRAGLTPTDGGDSVAFAPDGKTMLIGDNRGVRWYDPAAGKVIRHFDGSADPVNGPKEPGRFTPDGKTLVGSSGRALFRWDAATGAPRLPDIHAAAHFGRVAALGMSADGKRIATGTDSRIKVWDAATGKPVATFASDWLWPQNLEFAPDGKTLFAPGKGHVVRWDIATGKEAARYTVDPKEPPQAMTIGLRLSESGKTLTGITLSRKEMTPVHTVWTVATGERTFSKSLDAVEWSARRYRIHFSPDALFASLHGDVFPTAAGPTKGLLPPRTLGPGFDAGAFSGDGSRIAFTYIDEDDPPGVWRSVVYATATGAKVRDFAAGSGGRVALNTDGSILAAAGLTDLTFWDVNTGKLLARHKSPPAEKGFTVTSFAEVLRFTPDGTKLVTGHADTTALVWPVPKLPAPK